MVSKFGVGSQAFIIERNRIVREVSIVACKGDFYIARFADSNLGGGIQVRASRFFVSKEYAERALPECYKTKIKTGFRSPYDYGL